MGGPTAMTLLLQPISSLSWAGSTCSLPSFKAGEQYLRGRSEELIDDSRSRLHDTLRHTQKCASPNLGSTKATQVDTIKLNHHRLPGICNFLRLHYTNSFITQLLLTVFSGTLCLAPRFSFEICVKSFCVD